MDKFSIKVTLYDFIGYFIPGFVFILLIIISLNHSCPDKYPLYINLKNYFAIDSSESNNAINFSLYTYFVIILLLYIIGHIVSTLSSIIIEKFIRERCGIDRKSFLINNVLGNEQFDTFAKKIKTKFNMNYEERYFRICISFVELNRTSIYSTAFVFLTFYGMARSLAFITSLIFLWEVFNLFLNYTFMGLIYCVLLLILSVLFYSEFRRFQRYFKEQIVNGFLIEKEN